ncbi:YgfZ/GcvT domain-containing protein [Lusitaniella coriacea]|uniref:CAF17-like 4Fe-4S cluster assembly/insertion protein YgfZ n=1 Tax=Lusitaniella coriacea TaxID=1983105 RepID=UPI003CEC83FB
MNQELRQLQIQVGATFDPDATVPSSFGNDKDALRALQDSAVLCDRAHWGLIEVRDRDRLQFLHNQTTNDLKSLQPGQGCDTVFVTSTARTIDLATVYVTEDSVLLLVSPEQTQPLLDWLDRYLFPMDRVKLKDLSEEFAIFSLMGAKSAELLASMGVGEIPQQPEGNHQLVQLADMEVRIAVGSGLALPGYTLLIPEDRAATLWNRAIEAGAVPMGDRVWEQLRIQQGRPARDRELTDNYNPLEAGLWQAISFTKGCYIGQETIARLNTYKGVKQRLWGIRLAAPVPPGTTITLDERKVGTLTSHSETEEGAFGLGYVRTQAGGAGLKVKVGEVDGELVAVPFLTHEYYVPPIKE